MNKMPCADFHIKKKLIVILTIQQLCQEKSLLIVCLNITGAPWLWTHCCNNSCLKDLTFTLLSERNQNSDYPDWNMRNSTRRQTKRPPPTFFYIYIEIYIWRIINVWWVIKYNSFKLNICFFRSCFSISTVYRHLSVRPFVNFVIFTSNSKTAE